MGKVARGIKTVEMSEMRESPAWERLVEEVRASREPCLIRAAGEDLAVIMPAEPAPTRRRKRFSLDDSLFNIVGMAYSEGPGDVAENVDAYLANASLPKST